MKRWTERIPTTLNNVRTVSGWGLREFENVARFIGLGRTAGFGVAQPAFLRKLLDTATRLPFEYLPMPEPEAQTHSSYEYPPRDPYHMDEPVVALFVDSPEHTSGVSTTIGQWLTESGRQGLALTALSSGQSRPPEGFTHFPACGLLRLPCYAGLELPVPRVRDLLSFLDEHPFDAYHISTPGPIGLIGLLHARANGIPVCGTYHTDFPGYAASLTGDSVLQQTAWDLMKAFYGGMDLVSTPSEATRHELVAHGFEPGRLVVVGRGVYTDRFSPDRRTTCWQTEWGTERKRHLLYVGRVSKEKNLTLLNDTFRKICASHSDIALVIVGEGPYRAEMEEEMRGLPVIFTGTRKGEELASIYASCDLFVFPSETDTFGVVLIEAQASGLPVIVSDKGGPRHTMIDGKTGRIVAPLSAESLADAIMRLMADPSELKRMSTQARAHAVTMTPEASFNAFWAAHKHPCMQLRRGRQEARLAASPV